MRKGKSFHVGLRTYLLATFIFLYPALATSQTVPPKPLTSSASTSSPKLKPPSAAFTDEYRLGIDDQIVINVMFADELNNKTVRIDSSGYINIPFAGRVHAANLTIRELERDLVVKLKPYFESPNVVVNVAEYGSKPVSVLGEVHNPAVLQLHGPKTVVEMLSAAGGPTELAGSKLIITRQAACGPLPLPNAHMDPSKNFSNAEIDLSVLLDGDAAENIMVCADDTITVPRAKLFYVMGDVHKPGGFPIHDTDSASVLQAIALAEGPLVTASSQHARILRAQPGSQRQEIEVNLERILDRRDPDIPLKADDILYVPNSKSKNALIRGVETAIQMGTGIVIWGVRP